LLSSSRIRVSSRVSPSPSPSQVHNTEYRIPRLITHASKCSSNNNSHQEGAQQKANCNLTAFTKLLDPSPLSLPPLEPPFRNSENTVALSNCFFAMNNLTFLTFDLEKTREPEKTRNWNSSDIDRTKRNFCPVLKFQGNF